MNTTDEKKQYLREIMQKLVEKIKNGEGECWINEYADYFVNVWGDEEAAKQRRKMMLDSPMAPEAKTFCEVVGDVLRERNVSL